VLGRMALLLAAMMIAALSLGMMFFAAESTAAGETTNVLTSVADAGLSELAPTTNNGAATTLKVDGDDPDPGGKDLYAALRWDLSQIPAGPRSTPPP
jgi:hypothetical protein